MRAYPSHRLVVPFSLLLGWLACCHSALAKPAAEIDFSRDILPILSDNCFQCHGPDQAAREADLRLDTREGLSMVLGDPPRPDDSELLRRVLSDDPFERMPPPDTNRQLTPSQLDSLRAWLDAGAPWQQHWAFVPPSRPALPRVEFDAWPTGAIDYFVLNKLEQSGLSPAPRATLERLLRRVTLDVTGLPPTLEQLDQFLADRSAQAYERVVERLLASPRFGQRMAMDWLDAARYADTNGYQGDRERTMWPWRDWVVDALNRNLPFDKFTVWQLAGDLLPEASTEQRLATGFCRNHMINGEGGRIPEENRVEYIFDQIETLSTVWMGMTLQCCRCHDHKFDPLQQREYYELFAFFNQTPINGGGGDSQMPPNMAVPSREQTDLIAELSGELDQLEQRLSEAENQVHSRGECSPAQPSSYHASPSSHRDFTLPSEGSRAIERGGESRVDSHKNDPTDHTLSSPEDRFSRRESRVVLSSNQDSDSPGTTSTQPEGDLPIKLRDALELAPAERKPEHWSEIETHFAQSRPQLVALAKQWKSVDERLTSTRDAVPKVMVMQDAPRSEHRATYILEKGLYNQQREPVRADVPDVFPSLPDGTSADRLALARWLVDRAHPLTARVTVNRLWQQFFGVGLVKTPEDFGVQGEKPSHPELLDWLASELVRTGWDLKHIVRLIVTSSTYQQSAAADQQARERDPENRMLARGPRMRMPAWMIRDQALAAGGLLVDEVGGPPVKPYQPVGVWAEATFGKKKYQQDTGPDLYRRSLYVFWRRIVGPTMFFDMAKRQTCEVKTPRTNSPLHALVTLNDVTYVEAAKGLAVRAMRADGSSRDRIGWVFRLATSRQPTDEELDVLVTRLGELTRHYQASPQAADELLGVGQMSVAGVGPRAELAACTNVCLLILNLDETLNK